MKVIIGTSIVPTTTFIILFAELGILLISFPQFVYAQTTENEIIKNSLENVEKATTKGLSKIRESVNNASEKLKPSGLGFTDSDSKSLDKKEQSVQEKINQTYQVENTGNWIKGESDKLSFKYPSNWDVNVSDNRF